MRISDGCADVCSSDLIGSANRTIVHYGGEGASYTGSLLVASNEIISHGGNGTGVRNQTPIDVRIEDNVFHNVDTIARGSNSKSNNTIFDDLSHIGEPLGVVEQARPQSRTMPKDRKSGV